MTIIKIDPLESGLHLIESQSHRHTVWQDGYIEVPPHLIPAVDASGGYCDLIIEDNILVGITPTERPEPEPVPLVMTTEEAMLDMMADHDYRLGLIELGVQN